MWQRWLSVTQCVRDLQASSASVPYWKVWEWVRWHCSWRKEGNRVLVSEAEWRQFKAKVLSGWRPLRKDKGAGAVG
jgi:hypothetical protein